MIPLFNQFSYPMMALALLALIFFILRRRLTIRTLIGVEIVLAGVLLAGFFAFQTGEGDITTVQQFDEITVNGKPTFIEFFSNFCTGCLVARPGVDRLVDDISPTFNIVRINIHTETGRALSERYDFTFTPEFVLLDSAGGEVWRAHVVPTDAELQSAQAN